MVWYLIKRLMLAVTTMLVIMLVSYFLLRLAPGDPTKSSMFGNDGNVQASSADKNDFAVNQSLRDELHLDEPIAVGFYYWLKGVILHGDFGRSATVDPGRPVTSLILSRLPITIKLNVMAVLLTYFFAIVLGVFAAVRAGGWFDRSSTIVLFVLYSLPVIWVGLVLQAAFCSGGWWPIFPLKGVPGEVPEGYTVLEGVLFQLQYSILPVICLAYAGFAGLSRYARNGMLEVIQQDYIRTARAKGLSEQDVIWKHAFRNGIITLITLFSGLLPGLVAGSIIIEHIFSIPGMGSLSLLSLSSRDYPLQMALFCFSGILTLTGIFLSDLLYMLADPRISLIRNKNS